MVSYSYLLTGIISCIAMQSIERKWVLVQILSPVKSVSQSVGRSVRWIVAKWLIGSGYLLGW